MHFEMKSRQVKSLNSHSILAIRTTQPKGINFSNVLVMVVLGGLRLEGRAIKVDCFLLHEDVPEFDGKFEPKIQRVR